MKIITLVLLILHAWANEKSIQVFFTCILQCRNEARKANNCDGIKNDKICREIYNINTILQGKMTDKEWMYESCTWFDYYLFKEYDEPVEY